MVVVGMLPMVKFICREYSLSNPKCFYEISDLLNYSSKCIVILGKLNL